MTCTFFGHSIVADEIDTVLRNTLIDLIEKHDVNMFYVGNQGEFDRIVKRVLSALSEKYPIGYSIVLAYMPTEKKDDEFEDYSHTLYPDGIEAVPKRFAISYRNKWMIRRADYVVTYIIHTWGGAAQFAETAKRQGKTVINIA